MEYMSSACITLWDGVLDLFGRSEPLLFTVGTMASLGIPFWITVALFSYIDITGKPGFLHKYKIQPDKNVPVDWKMYKKCLHVVNRNQAVAAVIVLLMYPLYARRGTKYESGDLPGGAEVLLHFIGFVLFQEAAFYYLHRLMHHPLLYKRIHKVHHEWTAPISLAVVYVHPFEHIIVNMIPVLSAPLLFGSHLCLAWTWNMGATVISTIHHSGYHFPWFPSPEFHDYHHLKFNQCFGVLGFLDRLHNTDELFRKSKNHKHDHMFFNMKPVWSTK